MTIVRCPRCRDEVTVPAKASGRALVRCPLCLEEYLLAEALGSAPPPLVIIGGEVEQAAIDSSAARGSEYQLAAAAPAAGILEVNASTPTTVVGRRPPQRPTPLPRRKEESTLSLLVNVIAGGVFAAPLALLTLWWAFRTDPLELGPPVAKYVPWIVPQPFHGKSDSTTNNATAPPSKAASGAVAADGKERGSKKAAATRPAAGGTETPSASSQGEPARLDATQPTLTPASDIPSVKERGASGGKTARNPLAKTKATSAMAVPAATEPASSRPPMLDLTDLLPDGPFVIAPSTTVNPPVTAAEFGEAVDASLDALAKYERIPREDGGAARQAFVDLYIAAGAVGRIISYLDPAAANLAESIGKMQSLLDALSGAKGMSRVRPIKFVTVQQWPERVSGDGFLAAGTVQEFKSVGSLFEVTLDASVRDSALMLPAITSKSPRDLCEVGDELIVIGRVIEPARDLPGYEGNEPRALLIAFAVRVPRTNRQ